MRWMLTPAGLEPFDAEAREFHHDLSSGEPFAAQVIEIEPLYDRDMVEHRRIMATIGDVAKALHTTQEKLRAELLVATGNFQLLGELLGQTVVAVNSMSRHNMKDHELHEFWGDAREIIKNRLLPKITDPGERERLSETLSLQPA